MARRYRDSASRRRMRDMARSRQTRVRGYMRDRAYDRYGDNDGNPEYRIRLSDGVRSYGDERGRRDYKYDRERGRYNDYDYDMNRDYDYDMRRDYDYGYSEDERRGRDYASKDGKHLTDDELMEWTKQLYQDLSESEKALFTKMIVERKAKEMGIKFDKFSFEEFYATVLMLVTDYKDALGATNNEHYIKLAKLWLCDEDAEVQYGEKLAAYYDAIVVGE